MSRPFTLTVPGAQSTLLNLLTGRAVTGRGVGDRVEFADLPG